MKEQMLNKYPAKREAWSSESSALIYTTSTEIYKHLWARLANQCWIHKQKVVGSSLVTVNLLCPCVRYLTIITPLHPYV